MTTPSTGATALRPEVGQFLDRVRDQLADLSVDERDELLDGLDADLSEQLAEGGALPDPGAYAAELRAAAGLPPPRPVRRGRVRRSLGVHLVSAPDDLRGRWLALTARNDLTRQAWSLLEAVRPAWWVLRAWVAVSLLDALAGPWENLTLLPTLGVPVLGPVLLLGAIVVSVWIGQGRLWPGSGPDRSLLARLVLAALNLLAILAPLTFHYPGSHPYVVDATMARAVVVHRSGDHPVLRSGGDVIRNVYAYDAEGQPLQGVQLFDQEGRPISVAPQSSMGAGPDRQVTCPWFNGTTALFNVFPLPQRAQRYGSCLGPVDPAKVGQQGFHEPPLASVPPATLPAGPQG